MKEVKEITKEQSAKLLKNNMDILKINIKKLIKERGWTHEDLAFAVNSNRPFISYFLRRSGNATIDFVGRIAEALDTNISELTKK